jgi:agmatinase
MELKNNKNFAYIKEGLIIKSTGFIGSTEDYSSAALVILGIPLDCTVSFRPGTRFGPQEIRLQSEGLETYSPYLDRDLIDYVYCDVGNIILPPGQLKECFRRIQVVINSLLKEGKFPLFLGGEHLITLPAVEAVARLYPDLTVLQFDAHADLRDVYLGDNFSHATVMRRITEIIGGKNLFQFGIRSGTKEEFIFAQKETNFFPFEVKEPFKKVNSSLRGRPVYITLDIDVCDPAYAPGVGTPEPGGCTPQELIQALHLMGAQQVVGMDLVEINPLSDPTARTAALGAKLVREAILSFGRPCL